MMWCTLRRRWLWLAMTTSACADPPLEAVNPTLDDTGGATAMADDDGATGQPTMSTTTPDGSGDGTSNDTADATASADDRGPAGTDDGGDRCGDGIVQASEDCDGEDLAGATCSTLGFDDGTLACDEGCAYDKSGCVAAACGDGTIAAGEACEPTDLAGQSCANHGYDQGQLACDATCTGFDVSACFSVVTVCGTGLPMTIPPNNATGITIPIVVDDPRSVLDVDVVLEIDHTYMWDVDVVLARPAAASQLLINNVNTPGGLQCSADNLEATLDDEAASPVWDACNPFDNPAVLGTFSPEEPLSAFDGAAASGVWNLIVDDDHTGGSGSVVDACLILSLH